MVEQVCPLTWKAFEDFRLHSLRFSGPEVELLQLLHGPGGDADRKRAAEIVVEMTRSEKAHLVASAARVGLVIPPEILG